MKLLDTNILISAAHWPQSVARRLLLSGLVRPVTSPDILLEFQEVLRRDFGVSAVEAATIAGALSRSFITVAATDPPRLVLADAGDDKVLWCALVGEAELIVTYDQHLLGLDPFRGVRIVTPEDAFAYGLDEHPSGSTRKSSGK